MMKTDTHPALREQLYNERLNRYMTAMRNEKPDKIQQGVATHK